MIGKIKTWAYRFLRRGERYTGTDNVYLAKGGIFFSIAQFIGSMSSLILAVVFSRLIDKEVYGTYQYLLSWGSIFSIASLTGMSDALTQAVARNFDRSLFGVIRTRLHWSLLGLAGAAMIGGYYLFHGRADLFAGFLVVGLSFPLNGVLSAWADYAIGKKRFDLQTRLSVMTVLISFAGVLAALLFKPTPVFLVAAFCFSYLVGNVVSLLVVLKKLPPSEGSDPAVLKYGKKLTLIDIIGSISTYFDRIIIFTLLGAHETAIYAFAIAPPEQLKGYLKNLYFLALPKISVSAIAEIKKTFFKKMLAMMAGVSLIILAYIAIAPFVYRLLFPNYAEAVGFSQLFAVSLLATASILPSAVFAGQKKYAENVHYQAVSSIANILLLTVFVWKMGLLGAVIARIIGRFFGLAYALVLTKKIFNQPSPTEPPNRNPDSATPVLP